MTPDEIKTLEDQLWSSANQLRANTPLKSSEYATPVLGLIFLKFADNKYRKFEQEIEAEYKRRQSSSRREVNKPEIAVEKCGYYLPDNARYDYLLHLPEEQDLATAIQQAMQDIEKFKNDDAFKNVLPTVEYAPFNANDNSRRALTELVRTFSNIPSDATGDIFGKIYEYFLGKFALSEGQKGGEFFTPPSVVRLMVDIIEPYHGTVFDPACGSGGMFVQSLHFVERRNELLRHLGQNPDEQIDLSVKGQEKTGDTVKLAKMNLFVNGLKGEIQQANTYEEDPFNSFEKFDFILANPPFNVDEVPVTTVEHDQRFNSYGLPRNKGKKANSKDIETIPNANYLWINLFATSLKNQEKAQANNSGRAGLVMPNSASDARNAETEIRQKLIENNLIYGMVTLPSNMFYTVTLPATLWFFDRNKADDKILFIDARNIFRQIDRAHRDFTDEQIQNIAMISKLHQGRRGEYIQLIHGYFGAGMAILQKTVKDVEPVLEQLQTVLANDKDALATVEQMTKHWHGMEALDSQFSEYQLTFATQSKQISLDARSFDDKQSQLIDSLNTSQIALSDGFEPFFKALHDDAKALDKFIREQEKTLNGELKLARQKLSEIKNRTNKTDRDKEEQKDQDKVVKDLSEQASQIRSVKDLLAEVKADRQSAEYFFGHIRWLQERFPSAKYEDVTGLCKLASPAEVAEQEYSLNAGRYVGVVIEEDGKTEDEFLEDLQLLNDEFLSLSEQALSLEKIINANLESILSGN